MVFDNNKTIEKIIDGSKKTLVRLGIIGLAGCATYAERNYNHFPDQKDKVAYHNLRIIATDACGEGYSLTKDDFSCRWKECTMARNTGGEWKREVCYYLAVTKKRISECDFNFSEVKGVFRVGSEVNIQLQNGEKKLSLKNNPQAKDFAEALAIYLNER